jgi:hypothetical protein
MSTDMDAKLKELQKIPQDIKRPIITNNPVLWAMP